MSVRLAPSFVLLGGLVLAAGNMFVLAPAFGQSPASSAEVTLPASDEPAAGRIGINMAAGVANQEANSAVIAIGDAALASGSVHQLLKSSGVTGGNATAAIAEGALAGASGMAAVNVAAGHENQLGNLAVIAIGIEAIAATETVLAQSRASHQPNGSPDPSPPGTHVADLAPGAFAGSSGLVQSNLVGGERNSSSNTFALTVLGEDPL